MPHGTLKTGDGPPLAWTARQIAQMRRLDRRWLQAAPDQVAQRRFARSGPQRFFRQVHHLTGCRLPAYRRWRFFGPRAARLWFWFWRGHLVTQHLDRLLKTQMAHALQPVEHIAMQLARPETREAVRPHRQAVAALFLVKRAAPQQRASPLARRGSQVLFDNPPQIVLLPSTAQSSVCIGGLLPCET